MFSLSEKVCPAPFKLTELFFIISSEKIVILLKKKWSQ